MLTGEYSHSIDTKGRLIIPSRLREELGDVFAVTKGVDGCLLLYPEDAWNEFARRLMELPAVSNSKARAIKRFFLGSALTAEFDKQGRISLPKPLLQHADITAEAVIVGMGDHAEIWSRERLDEKNAEDDIEALADEMGEFGLNF
jgi:MraZ protein